MSAPYDFIAIGLGPFNLSLACLAAPIRDLRGLFLERNSGFDWHPGMLLDDVTLQNPFLADLVSLADPRSRYSFLNYCKQEGKLYAYYIRERFYLSRAEYNRYCQWVVRQLPGLAFGRQVERVEYDEARQCYRVHGYELETGRPFAYEAAKLVIGVGSSPQLPACCAGSSLPLLHSAHYAEHKAAIQQTGAITVVGSGQSAAEIFHDLLREADAHRYSLSWITRAPRFFQMENTKLTLEMISPDYADYFFGLNDGVKAAVIRQQDSLYKGVNASLINQIYDLLDDRRSQGLPLPRLVTNSELTACDHDGTQYQLRFVQRDLGEHYLHRTDSVVFATGYRQHIPAFLDGIRERIRWDEAGRYQSARNYAIDRQGREIFVQNGGLHSHGLTNPDLGLCCYRNSCILRELTGVEHYPIEQRIALQDFAVPEGAGFMRIPVGVQ